MAGTYGRAPIWAGNLPEAFNYVGSPLKKKWHLHNLHIGNPSLVNGHVPWAFELDNHQTLCDSQMVPAE